MGNPEEVPVTNLRGKKNIHIETKARNMARKWRWDLLSQIRKGL